MEGVAITVCHLQLATGDFADFQRLDSAVGEVQDKSSGCTHIILVVIITIVSKCAIGVLVGNVVTAVSTRSIVALDMALETECAVLFKRKDVGEEIILFRPGANQFVLDFL